MCGLAPTQDSFALLHWLEAMWPNPVAKAGRNASFRHVEVALFDLVEVGHRQHDLFLRADREGSPTRLFETLWHEIDRVNADLGRGVLTLASQLGQNLQYAGAKIAFSRVPGRHEFQQSALDRAEGQKAALRLKGRLKERRSFGWSQVP